jgi:hypothetical protein
MRIGREKTAGLMRVACAGMLAGCRINFYHSLGLLDLRQSFQHGKAPDVKCPK